MKSEPNTFSINDLKLAKHQTTFWEGVRNYQARNFLRNAIKVGDGILFYHSNSHPSGIAGEAVIVREGYPDHTAWDQHSVYYDPKSDRGNPVWYMVDVKFVRACKKVITLKRLRAVHSLRQMMVLKRGSRLSIQPVTSTEWKAILGLPEWGSGALKNTYLMNV